LLDDSPLQLVEPVEVCKGVVPARFGGDGLGAAVATRKAGTSTTAAS
jgi:hypothetical protein